MEGVEDISSREPWTFKLVLYGIRDKFMYEWIHIIFLCDNNQLKRPTCMQWGVQKNISYQFKIVHKLIISYINLE